MRKTGFIAICSTLGLQVLWTPAIADQDSKDSSAPRQHEDGAAAQPASSEAPQVPAQPSGEDLASAAELVDAWERLLKESKYAELKFRCVRTRSDRDLSIENGEPELKYEILVRAQAVMKPDAHWLVVWEGEEGEQREPEGPVLTIEFQDGQIRENLWYPGLKQYRTKRYPADSPFGTNDSEYENACQIGTLLGTWLGDNPIPMTLVERMRLAEPLPDIQIIGGERCRGYRLELTHESVHSYFLDSRGCLRRWETRVTNREGNIEKVITQMRDYQFDFRPEAPAQSQGGAAAIGP